MPGKGRYTFILPDFCRKVNETDKKVRAAYIGFVHVAVLPKIPPRGMKKLPQNLRNTQLTFCTYISRIISIHYVSIIRFVPLLRIQALGGNHFEGLGIYNYRRGDGSCHQRSAGNSKQGWR
jgi:hypothetical protein